MSPGEDYVLHRDFERYTVANDSRWDKLVAKVDTLADSSIIDRQRILVLEKIANEKSSQSFTQSITAAQAGYGCLIAIVAASLTFVFGIVGAIIANWVLHH